MTKKKKKADSKGKKQGGLQTSQQEREREPFSFVLKFSRKKSLSLKWCDSPTNRLCCTIDGALSDDECQKLISCIRDLGTWGVTTSRGPKHGEAERHHKRIRKHDCMIARMLWEQTGLEDLCSTSLPVLSNGRKCLCLSPDIRLYQYERGDLFGQHYCTFSSILSVSCDSLARAANETAPFFLLPTTPDGSDVVIFERDLKSPKHAKHGKSSWNEEDRGKVGQEYMTEYTLLLYLNGTEDGLVGGETNFYSEARNGSRLLYSVKPRTGTVLLHKHGDGKREKESKCLLLSSETDPFP